MGAEIVNNHPGNPRQSTTGLLNEAVNRLQLIGDAFIPPDQRAIWWERIRGFVVSNPKLAAFLLTNIVLSGPPLFLFVVFTTTVFIVSLVAGLILALIAALSFSVFMLLVALFIILPTIFLTTMAATFTFVWALGAFYLIRYFNEGKTPAEAGVAIRNALNSASGGLLTWAVDSLRAPVHDSATKNDHTVDALVSEDDANKVLSDTRNFVNTPKKTPPKVPFKRPTQVAV